MSQQQSQNAATDTLDTRSTTLIVLNNQLESPSYKESSHTFQCPNGTIMIGRYHTGDENGQTAYLYASLKAIDSSGNIVPGTIAITYSSWSAWQKESSSDFAAPSNQVIAGRRHNGDENGDTSYMTGQIYFNNRLCYIEPEADSLRITVKESAGLWARKDIPMIRRWHSGDENGNTTYYFGRMVL